MGILVQRWQLGANGRWPHFLWTDVRRGPLLFSTGVLPRVVLLCCLSLLPGDFSGVSL
jgi:hypothetical protein